MSELTGSSDICHPVADLSTIQAKAYLCEGEIVLFALTSPKEEYAFTSHSLITIRGESSMTTKRMVERYEYITHCLSNIKFETCGVTDRDCELKFNMAAQSFSIDIAKSEQTKGQHFYRVLHAIEREQTRNTRRWEFARTALDASVKTTQLQVTNANGNANDVTIMTQQATAVQTWLEEWFLKTNPHSYQSVIEAALSQE